MDRRKLLKTWIRLYSQMSLSEALTAIRGRVGYLGGRMRKLAQHPSGKLWHGIPGQRLQVVLGMSLGVHKQLLWGLTSYPWRGVDWRVEGGNRFKIDPTGQFIIDTRQSEGGI